MPTLSITKSYADGDILLEADIDNIRGALLTFLNTTKIDSDNVQDEGITLGKLAATIQAALNPTGTVHAFVGAAAPTGYLVCNGAAVSRTTYSALYAVIGDAYGYGDNATTFNLPDFRGRFLRGYDNGAGRDPNAGARSAAATGGNTGDNIGSVQDDATAKNGLTATAASSSVSASGTTASGGNHQHSPAANTKFLTTNAGGSAGVQMTGGSIDAIYFEDNTSIDGSHTHTVDVTGTAAAQSITVGAGDSETRPVNINVNYIIKY